MNFLAHLYLSGEDEDLQFGNFIADAVRGKQLYSFPPNIQQGIQLHRTIDTFTDQNEIFRKHCRLFSKDHGHYSRVLMDVIYDHVLAQNWEHYHPSELEKYAVSFFQKTSLRSHELPPKMQPLFSTMKKQNWLLQYRSLEELEHIFYHMSKRTSFPSDFTKAIPTLKEHSALLTDEFHLFFDALQQHVQAYLSDKNISVDFRTFKG